MTDDNDDKNYGEHKENTENPKDDDGADIHLSISIPVERSSFISSSIVGIKHACQTNRTPCSIREAIGKYNGCVL